MYSVKTHYVNGEVVVAVCDIELLGKELWDKERGISLYINPEFYAGKIVDNIEEVIREVERATIANIVGKRVIEELCKRYPSIRKYVKVIGGVPQIQIVTM